MNPRITFKYYMRWFDLAEITAKRWLASDRKKLGKKRIVFADVAPIYGLTSSDL